MATLKMVKLKFGIPGWATDDGWDGDEILVAAVEFHCDNGSIYHGGHERRNESIGPNQVVNLDVLFLHPEDMVKITYDNLSLVKITYRALPGHGMPPARQCRFRTEAVLLFDDNSLFVTPGPDPAPTINPGGLKNTWTGTYPRDLFQNKESLTDGQVG